MRDDIKRVRAHYERTGWGEDSRLARHQLERDITLCYFEAYLPPEGRVLEIGAATGAYTAWLAGRGHRVTAVDLSGKLIEQCRSRLVEMGLASSVDCYAADARNLSSVPGDGFDAILLMGPLYHLIERRNRLAALRESVGRLKTGGVLLSAHISRFGILGDLLRQIPGWVERPRDVRSVIERGHDPEDHVEFPGYFTRLEEVAPLHEEAGLETLLVAGVEPAISADDESYNKLEGERRRLWLELLYELSREPTMVASSRHLLYIGRKAALRRSESARNRRRRERR